MIEAPHYTSAGAKRGTNFALPADYFDGTVNEPVLHQAVKVYLNNQRQGTHMTKSRSFVSGGNQKPWKQKGTGRARQGSIRATQWKGGGKPFGPTPRKYDKKMPTEMRRAALREALAAKIATKSPLALRLAKEAVNGAYEMSLTDGLAHERRLFYLLFASEDQKEGMAAFLEKRDPDFKGR